MDPRFFRKYLEVLNEAPDTPAEPSKWQQAKTAIGQQYQNYKDAAGMVDAATQQTGMSQQDAQDIKGQLGGSMIKAGVRAGMHDGDPGVFMGSMMGDVADSAAGMSGAYKDAYKKYGPGSEGYKKLSPDQQRLVSITPDQYDATVAGGRQAATQMMNPQKPTGAASGTVPKLNAAFGLDPNREYTDAEIDAAATNTNEELDRIKQLIRKK